MSQARFQKIQRERAKREKALAKQERKAQRAEEAELAAAEAPDEPIVPESTVLEQLASLHQRFDDDQIDFDTFEERKQELIAQLDVES
jgi:hypothetical protein